MEILINTLVFLLGFVVGFYGGSLMFNKKIEKSDNKNIWNY